MKKQVTRRDLLKLAGMLPVSLAIPRFADSLPVTEEKKNVLIILFDALSANNCSMYGYQRDTIPNLVRLANRAIVYHNHHASGNFTTPGTASLFTGTYPWTHRAFQHRETVAESFLEKNIFSSFHDYYRISYSHNPLAHELLNQLVGSLDNLIPRERFYLKTTLDISMLPNLFKNDEDIAVLSWIRTIKPDLDGDSYSLFLSHLFKFYKEKVDKTFDDLKAIYPRGIPGVHSNNYFLLEDVIDWLINNLNMLPQPFLGYFHFLPPHAPYTTHLDFYNRFQGDGFTTNLKSLDLFSESDHQVEIGNRTMYDEFILYADRELGRLFQYLDNSGLLDNTWVILTSDHGELFERGIVGHQTPVLYQPVIRVPLMIFEPGRETRFDVHMPTSVVDLLPTLLQVTGHSPVNWAEGMVLPPYLNGYPGDNRSIYALEAKKSKKYDPLAIATTILVKGGYKLMYFFGYDELNGGERIELYDIENDPEEMNNLYLSKRETADELLEDLKTKIAEENAPFQ